MDVEDPAAPFLDEPGRENSHEAGKGDRSDIVLVERGAELAVEYFLCHALAFECPDFKSASLRPR